MSSAELIADIARLLTERHDGWGYLQGRYVQYRYQSQAGHMILKCDPIDMLGVAPDFEALLDWTGEHGVRMEAWVVADGVGFVPVPRPANIPHPFDTVEGHFIRGFEFRLISDE